jgi:hypothetical protein
MRDQFTILYKIPNCTYVEESEQYVTLHKMILVVVNMMAGTLIVIQERIYSIYY